MMDKISDPINDYSVKQILKLSGLIFCHFYHALSHSTQTSPELVYKTKTTGNKLRRADGAKRQFQMISANFEYKQYIYLEGRSSGGGAAKPIPWGPGTRRSY